MSERIEPAKDTIEAHMRELGPAARVLLIVDNTDVSDKIIRGETGLLARYKNEFSSVDSRNQVTHRLGGTIKVATTYQAGVRGRIEGQTFSCVWTENVEGSMREEREALKVARLCLRISPCLFIKSTNGTFVEEARK